MSPETTRRILLKAGAAGTALTLSGRLMSQQPGMKVMTIAGDGTPGVAAEGALASTAINNPYGLVIGPDGQLYWCDLGSNRILRLDLAQRTIHIVAGNGENAWYGDGGPATEAALSTPHEVRFDRHGDIYFCERDNHVIRRVDMKTGLIDTIAGNGTAGFAGDGGPATESVLKQPHSIAFDAAGNLYICDIGNHRVRRISPDSGIITTFAGTGETGPAPDSGKLATTVLTGPRSIDIAPDGSMYLILREGNAVYRVDIGRGELRRLAGTGELKYSGDGGPAIEATFGRPGHPLNGPKGIAWAPGELLYIVDTENHAIRLIDLKTGIINTILGTGNRADGGEGDPLQCSLARPHGVFMHGATIFIGDSENHRIRALVPA